MSNSYIQPADLKVLGYDPLPELDILHGICLATSAIADNFCLQSLGVQKTEEIIQVKFGTGGINKLFPTYLPIVKINHIYRYYDLTNYTEIDPSEYEFDNRAGYVSLTSGNYGKLKIDYDHGYEKIPHDVKRALLSIAANLISDNKRRNQIAFENAAEITDDKQKIKFFDTATEEDIPNSAKKILMRYKKVR